MHLSGLNSMDRKKIFSLGSIFIFCALLGLAPRQKVGDPFLPNQGKINLLVVLVSFPDQPQKAEAREIERLLFSRGELPLGSVADYYYEVSQGRVEITGTVLGWSQAAQPQNYYANSSSGHQAGAYPRNAAGLVNEAIEFAEKQGVNFSGYDNSKSGSVDGLVVVFSGPGGQIGSNKDRLWPWLSYLSMDGAKPLVKNEARIDRYILVNEQDGKGEVSLVPGFCHELGHLFGLPDLYAWTGSSSGIGSFGLMSAGVYGKGKSFWPSAWPRSYLGWTDTKELTSHARYLLGPAEKNGPVFKIATFRPEEYFLLENRQPIGSDAGLFGKGLVVYHIDERVLNANNHVCIGLCPDNHYMVSVVQADGMNHLEKKTNTGDSSDFFPGAGRVTEISDTTGAGPQRMNGAHLRLWDGELSGLRISEIKLDKDEVGFNLDLADFNSPDPFLPGLRLYDYKIIDDNNDQVLEPGEQFQFVPVISNQGVKAKDVKLTLTSMDLAPENSEITLEDSIKPGQRIEAPPFKRKATLYEPAAKEVELNLNIQARPEKFSRDEKIKIVIGVPEIVLVMDDGGLGLKSYYEKALRDNDKIFHVIIIKNELPSQELLAKFKLVIWATGVRGYAQTPALDEARQKLLTALLDQGKKIILVSPGIELKPDSEFGVKLGIKSAKNNFGLKAFKVEGHPEAAIGLYQPYYPAINPSSIIEPTESAKVLYRNLQGDPVGILFQTDKTSIATIAIPLEALYDGPRKNTLSQVLNQMGF